MVKICKDQLCVWIGYDDSGEFLGKILQYPDRYTIHLGNDSLAFAFWPEIAIAHSFASAKKILIAAIEQSAIKTMA